MDEKLNDNLKDLLLSETFKAYKDGYDAGFREGVKVGQAELAKAALAIIHGGDLPKDTEALS